MSEGLQQQVAAEPPAAPAAASARTPRRSKRKFAMAEDRPIGDGGNVTVYERPDSSQYALDKRGAGREWKAGEPIFGRARFDSRPLATGRWEGSRSLPQEIATGEAAEPGNRARRRGSRFRTG